MIPTIESRWLSRGIVLAAVALAAWLVLSSGTAFADGGVVFDPEPEEIPGMGGLSTFINYTAWGVAIICGVAFLGTIGWLAISVFTGQEFRAGKGMIVAIVAMILLGGAGVIVGAFL